MNEFSFKGLLQNDGWIDNVTIQTDELGIIKSIRSGVKSKSTHRGYALPGFQNAHSHAFQYAMAGYREMLCAGLRICVRASARALARYSRYNGSSARRRYTRTS